LRCDLAGRQRCQQLKLGWGEVYETLSWVRRRRGHRGSVREADDLGLGSVAVASERPQHRPQRATSS